MGNNELKKYVTWEDVKRRYTNVASSSIAGRDSIPAFQQDAINSGRLKVQDDGISMEAKEFYASPQDIINRYYEKAKRSTASVSNGIFNTAAALAKNDGYNLNELVNQRQYPAYNSEVSDQNEIGNDVGLGFNQFSRGR